MTTLPTHVIKNLGDRSYEKRKQAALEIEHLIKEGSGNGGRNPEQITSLIHVLSRDYAYSPHSNHRKGGLIGLAATAIALMEDTRLYLELLLPPVLKCFTDQESRVRYYACEALYNISKVARGSVLMFFNEIFDGLCKLYSDVDSDVKSGAQLLDRLMKDIVTESEAFDVIKFMPLLRERIKIRHPFIRQLVVGWIAVLDSVPDLDMIEYLPEYMTGLFDMLSDPNKDIRQQSYAVISEMLREITTTMQRQAEEEKERAKAAAEGGSSGSAVPSIPSIRVDLASMITLLVSICTESRDNFTKLTVLTWINEFLSIGSHATLLPLAADMLGVALQCISHAEKEIRLKSERTNDMLLHMCSTTQHSLPLVALLSKLTGSLHSAWVPSRLASLRWISMLLSKLPGALEPYLDNDLLPVLLNTLQDADDQLVKLALEVMARITLDADASIDRRNFKKVLKHILSLFRLDRRFLEIRGSFVIRTLCELLDAEEIYRMWSMMLAGEDEAEAKQEAATANANGHVGAPPVPAALSASTSPAIAATLSSTPLHQDYDFVSLMVQTLNLILLTSQELVTLRNKLKHCPTPNQADPAASSLPSSSSSSGLDLFQCLYSSWVVNPIATFSLCLLTQCFTLSSSLILRVAKVELSVNTLMQVDKLIQLLESPIFLHLRLRLLEEPHASNNNIALLKSLYGILTLLPQSNAFTSLKTRLESVAPLVLLIKGEREEREREKEREKGSKSSKHATSSTAASQPSLESQLPISAMLSRFEDVQSRYAASKQRAANSKSLIKQKQNTTPTTTATTTTNSSKTK